MRRVQVGGAEWLKAQGTTLGADNGIGEQPTTHSAAVRATRRHESSMQHERSVRRCACTARDLCSAAA